MEDDFFGVCATCFRFSFGGILFVPTGVFGVLRLSAVCFLVRVGLSVSFSGKQSADRMLLAEAGRLGVELASRRSVGVALPDLRPTGDVFPLREDALLSTGDAVPSEDSLLLAGDSFGGSGDTLRGSRVTGRTSALLPWVTRRTWHGSCRDRKCSSVSHPPPTRTIMCRPFSNWKADVNRDNN